MTSINKIILIGTVDAMPVYNLLPSEKKVVKLFVKTEEADGQSEKHRVLLYGKAGDFALKNLQTGMPVYIEGRIQYRQYVGQNGARREQTNIIAHRMQQLSRKTGFQPERDRQKKMALAGEKGQPMPQPRAGQPVLLMAPPSHMPPPETVSRHGGKPG